MCEEEEGEKAVYLVSGFVFRRFLFMVCILVFIDFYGSSISMSMLYLVALKYICRSFSNGTCRRMRRVCIAHITGSSTRVLE